MPSGTSIRLGARGIASPQSWCNQACNRRANLTSTAACSARWPLRRGRKSPLVPLAILSLLGGFYASLHVFPAVVLAGVFEVDVVSEQFK